jgi:uncharacterized protein
MIQDTNRIDVADALRGFSILGIVLLHSIEHFNFYSYPEVNSEWLRFTDKVIWDGLFFTFGGKAYAIFSLLFGFSFFIQDANQQKRGHDFRLRFAWRLILLFIWGNLNAMFFTAEVLVSFAIMGFILIPANRLNNKTLFVIAIVCMLQPVEWGKLIYALAHPDYIPSPGAGGYHWGQTFQAQSGASFLEMLKVNLWSGQMASLLWAWENGRFFQIASLFIAGLLIGRTQFFVYSESHSKLWRQVLVASILSFFPLYGLTNILPEFIQHPAVLTPLMLIVKSLSNASFMIFLASLVVLVFYTTVKGRQWFGRLIPLGKMSLTAYITQSVMGSFIFYNWGLGWHTRLGITASFFVGVLLFFIQYRFANWWMKTHKQGPLEYLWKKATWIKIAN